MNRIKDFIQKHDNRENICSIRSLKNAVSNWLEGKNEVEAEINFKGTHNYIIEINEVRGKYTGLIVYFEEPNYKKKEKEHKKNLKLMNFIFLEDREEKKAVIAVNDLATAIHKITLYLCGQLK